MNKVRQIRPRRRGAQRSGAHYLAAIKDDGRHVFYDGELVRT